MEMFLFLILLVFLVRLREGVENGAGTDGPLVVAVVGVRLLVAGLVARLVAIAAAVAGVFTAVDAVEGEEEGAEDDEEQAEDHGVLYRRRVEGDVGDAVGADGDEAQSGVSILGGFFVSVGGGGDGGDAGEGQ